MRERQTDTKIVGASNLQREEERSAGTAASADSDVLAGMLRSTTDAQGHASLLNSVATPGSSLARRSLLQLQRQYGNRYVQRVIALARQANGEGEVHADVESAIEGARGGGQTLDPSVRPQMESAFGADFSGVRVHTDSRSNSLNRAVNAVAFTTGQDIFFSGGAYNPASTAGKELLAHELTHVVQQSGAPVKFKLQVNEPGDVYEQEADTMAAAVVRTLETGSPKSESPGLATGAKPAIRRKCSCGGSGESHGECAECARKREARLRAKKQADLKPSCSANTSRPAVDPLAQALIQNRYAGVIDKAVIHSEDPSGSLTSTLDFGSKPRKSSELGSGSEKKDGKAQDTTADTGGLILNADVKVERPTYSRQAFLTNQGEASAADSDDDVVRLGQVEDDNDNASGTDSDSDSTTSSSSDSDGGSTTDQTDDATKLAQVGACSFTITYANIRNTGCPAGRCGAQIIYDVTGACGNGPGCPPIDGLTVTESVTTDNGCTPGGVTTGAGCPISSHAPFLPTCGEVRNCTDTYAFCASPAAFPAVGCTEKYTQKLFVGGTLAETHTITFTISRAAGGCSGTVTRS